MLFAPSAQSALIVGVDSQIGGALSAYLRGAGWIVYGTSRRQRDDDRVFRLDLANAEVCSSLPKADVAFICAAETKFARCRMFPAETSIVNVDGSVFVASRLVASGTFVVFISSNAVFDGRIAYRRAEEAVCPRTVYGEQKAEAERRLLSLGERVSIVRLAKVLVPGTSLLAGWIHSLERGERIRPFSDFVMAPLSVKLVVYALMKIAEARQGGIFQLSGSRDVTYVEVARYLGQCTEVAVPLICPLSSVEAGIPSCEVFQHTTLDCTRVRESFGIFPPDPWDTIRAMYNAVPR